MLDMSFQLLFFFICIYKPLTTQKAEIKLDLQRAGSHVPSTSNHSGSSSKSDTFDRRDQPISYDLIIEIGTHIGTNDRGVAELLIEKINVSGALSEATRKKLQGLGLLADVKNDTVELVYPPPGIGGAKSGKVTPETEEQVLKQLETLLREHQASIPRVRSAPKLSIIAPPELPLFKIVKLMDSGNEHGFALALKVMRR
jgi:hypothetical protein